MKHTEDKIDKLFNDAFENFEVEPSETSWLSIEKELNRDKIFQKRMTLVRYAVAASVLVCIFFGVLYITNDNQQNRVVSNATNATDSVKASSSEKKDNNKNVELKKQEVIRRTEPSTFKQEVAEVVEIKSKTSVKKSIKKNNTITNDSKRISEEEKNAIELLKKNEDIDKQQKAAQQLKIENHVEPTTVAAVKSQSEKKEIGNVLDAVNYVAGRITKDEDTKVIAVNDRVTSDGAKRKSYQVDLGIIKFSRVRHTN